MSDKASMLRMPKLMITGYIEGQYEDTSTKSGDQSNHSYRFTELLGLNARGFVVDRRLLIYNVGMDLTESQGNGPGSKYDYFAVRLDLLFLPFRPFSFGLRASYADAQGGLVSKGAGLSVVYTRSGYVPSAAQQIQKQKQQQQGQGQQGVKLQQDANKDEEEPSEQIQKQNVVKEAPRPAGPGFLFSILPKVYNLDFDVYNNRSSTEDKTYYNTRLYMKGDYGKTDYFVNVADFYTKDNFSRTHTNDFFSDISTVTKWSQAVLNAKAYYNANSGTGTESSTSYGLLADTSGPFLKTWDYRVSANYQVTDDREKTTTYQTLAEVGSTSTKGNTTLGYRFGVGYNRNETGSDSADNASVSASLGTDTRVTSAYSIATFSGVSFGTELSLYSFRILNNFRPTSRLNLYLGYGIRDTFRHKDFTNFDEGPVHTIEAGVNYYNLISISSGITASISPKTEAENWNTIASTNIQRFNIVFGANLRREKPRGEFTELNGTETRSYDLYNIVSGPFFFRNSGFSVRTGYSRTRTKSLFDGGASRTSEIFSVQPLIRWFWRRLIIEAEGFYTITDESDGRRVTDRRIMVRVRRPFRLL